jgi:hypothetical protein
MAWQIKANIIESCSCALACPCIWGPAKPDQEWCSGVFAITIAEGQSEGVDLTGVQMLLHFELPGDFLGGIDKGKLYVDTSTSEQQRAEIDAIFHGERGGLWGGMKEAIGQWLPTQVTKVSIDHGESPSAQIEGVGEITVQRVVTDGTPGKIVGAPILGAFGIASADMGFAQGTKFSDPDMRAWESLGEGSMCAAEWAA